MEAEVNRTASMGDKLRAAQAWGPSPGSQETGRGEGGLMGSAAFDLSVGELVWSEHRQPNGSKEEVYGEGMGGVVPSVLGSSIITMYPCCRVTFVHSRESPQRAGGHVPFGTIERIELMLVGAGKAVKGHPCPPPPLPKCPGLRGLSAVIQR